MCETTCRLNSAELLDLIYSRYFDIPGVHKAELIGNLYGINLVFGEFLGQHSIKLINQVLSLLNPEFTVYLRWSLHKQCSILVSKSIIQLLKMHESSSLTENCQRFRQYWGIFAKRTNHQKISHARYICSIFIGYLWFWAEWMILANWKLNNAQSYSHTR